MSMELKPLVSVVTATYRNFDHLKETMRSVFQQDYPCIEYIITDDGSAEFPADMVDELVEKTFEGNIPSFVAAFMSSRKLNKDEIAKLKKMIDDYVHGRIAAPADPAEIEMI